MTWDKLPRRAQQQVLDHVDRQIATFRTDDIEEVVRWTIDGLGRTDAVVDSYNEGFEDGRQHEATELKAVGL